MGPIKTPAVQGPRIPGGVMVGGSDPQEAVGLWSHSWGHAGAPFLLLRGGEKAHLLVLLGPNEAIPVKDSGHQDMASTWYM